MEVVGIMVIWSRLELKDHQPQHGIVMLSRTPAAARDEVEAEGGQRREGSDLHRDER